MSNRFSLYPSSFVHAGGTLSMVQLGAARASMNSQFDEHIVGGAVDRGAVILQQAAPSVDLESADLATIFGVVSPTVGLSCTGNCIFQYQKRADQGVFAGAGTNTLATATKGFLLPTRLSASNGGRASLGLNFHALFDGTNEPLVFSQNQNLTGTPTFTSAFYGQIVYVNGSVVDSLLSASIDFGLAVVPQYEDGVVFPTLMSIVARTPTISLTFASVRHTIHTLTTAFIAALGGAIGVYFFKGVASGKRVANATTSHCKISAATGSWGADDISVQGNDDATLTVTVRPTAALAVSVASAIGG